MTNSSEVLIVGGGIIGCAIAYQLSKEGTKVTIIEPESVGSQASGAATGLLGARATVARPASFLGLPAQGGSRREHQPRKQGVTNGEITEDRGKRPPLYVPYHRETDAGANGQSQYQPEFGL